MIRTLPTANGWFTILHPTALDDGLPTIYVIFFTEFQSCQDDRRVIIKGWCNGIPVTVERFPSVEDFEPKTVSYD